MEGPRRQAPFGARPPCQFNLRANPAAAVHLRGETIPVTADEASGAETDRYWPRLVELWPAYRQFLAAGGQRAIFVLDPQDATIPAPDGATIT